MIRKWLLWLLLISDLVIDVKIFHFISMNFLNVMLTLFCGGGKCWISFYCRDKFRLIFRKQNDPNQIVGGGGGVMQIELVWRKNQNRNDSPLLVGWLVYQPMFCQQHYYVSNALIDDDFRETPNRKTFFFGAINI